MHKNKKKENDGVAKMLGYMENTVDNSTTVTTISCVSFLIVSFPLTTNVPRILLLYPILKMDCRLMDTNQATMSLDSLRQ